MTEYEIISTIVFAYITGLLLYLNRKQRRELMKLLKDTCDKDTKTLTDIRGRVNALVKERDKLKADVEELRSICADNNEKRKAAEKRVRELEKELAGAVDSLMAADKIKRLENERDKALKEALKSKQQEVNIRDRLKECERKYNLLLNKNSENQRIIKKDEKNQEEIKKLQAAHEEYLKTAAEKYNLITHIGQSVDAAESVPCVYIHSTTDGKGYVGETENLIKRVIDNFANYGSEFRDAAKDCDYNVRTIWATGEYLNNTNQRREVESFIIELGDYVNKGYNKRGGNKDKEKRKDFPEFWSDIDLEKVKFGTDVMASANIREDIKVKFDDSDNERGYTLISNVGEKEYKTAFNEMKKKVEYLCEKSNVDGAYLDYITTILGDGLLNYATVYRRLFNGRWISYNTFYKSTWRLSYVMAKLVKEHYVNNENAKSHHIYVDKDELPTKKTIDKFLNGGITLEELMSFMKIKEDD